jgi:hypothetical protein
MLVLLAEYKFTTCEEYIALKESQLSLLNELESIQKELDDVNRLITIEKFYHEPSLILSISKSPNGVSNWLGRVKVPKELHAYFQIGERERFYLNFIICLSERYSDKSDPELLELAKQKAQANIQARLDASNLGYLHKKLK